MTDTVFFTILYINYKLFEIDSLCHTFLSLSHLSTYNSTIFFGKSIGMTFHGLISIRHHVANTFVSLGLPPTPVSYFQGKYGYSYVLYSTAGQTSQLTFPLLYSS